MKRGTGSFGTRLMILLLLLGLATILGDRLRGDDKNANNREKDPIATHASKELARGRQVLRFDTFGEEAFLGRHTQTPPGD